MLLTRCVHKDYYDLAMPRSIVNIENGDECEECDGVTLLFEKREIKKECVVAIHERKKGDFPKRKDWEELMDVYPDTIPPNCPNKYGVS